MARWFDKDLKEAIKKLEQAQQLIDEALDLVDDLRNEQEEKMENVPESLQDTQKYETMGDRFESFDETCEMLEDFDLQDIIDKLEDME